MESEIDKAFDWLVLILGVIAAALCQFPELFPLGVGTQQIVGLPIVRFLVFPLVVLAIVWLWSHLARKMEYKIVLKSFSWIFASFMLTADMMLLLGATVVPLRELRGPTGWTGSPLHITVSILVMFLMPVVIPILLCLFVIRPRLREIYKESKFLYNFPQQALLFVLALATYLLSIGIFEGVQ